MAEAGADEGWLVRRAVPWPAVAIGLMAAVALPVVHLWLIRSQFAWAKSDLVAVWAGVQATAHGVDPYSPGTTEGIERLYYGRALGPGDQANRMGFAYPEFTAVVLAPLRWLTLGQARAVSLVVGPVAMAATVWLWLQVLGIAVSRRRLAVLTVLTLASWPMMWAFRLSQATLVVAALLPVACRLVQRRRDWLAGMVLALGLVKPQLVALPVGFVVLWAGVQRRWRVPMGFLAAALGLVAYAEVADPGWGKRWVGAMVEYGQYIHPEATLVRLFGPWLGGAAMVALGVGGTLALWRARRSGAESGAFGAAVALALALTVALMPTTLPMAYNEILLLPAVLLLVQERAVPGYAGVTRAVALGLLAAGFAAVPVAIVAESLRPGSGFWGAFPLMNVLLAPATALAATVGRFRRTG